MRTQISEALRQAFAGYEYGFNQGFIIGIDAESVVLPLVWLNPPVLMRKSGRERGTKEYAVNMYLLVSDLDPQTGAAYTPDRKAGKWEEMEAQVLDALEQVSSGGQMDVQELKIYPDELSITDSGEICLQVKFKITLPWCK